MNIRRGGDGLVILLAVQHRGISGMAICNEQTHECSLKITLEFVCTAHNMAVHSKSMF